MAISCLEKRHCTCNLKGGAMETTFTLNVSVSNHILWGTLSFELVIWVAHVGVTEAWTWKRHRSL